ncbi:far upstream element-binding protein 2-like [Cololabis saira]|uniref:far upstream element-binding protein 2-like n=1 Tax=Cololabis saira TaxID=129043 RepID=UPI002AD438E0|nr:far upstream element-binding protein 2-like [Cololabis saira]
MHQTVNVESDSQKKNQTQCTIIRSARSFSPPEPRKKGHSSPGSPAERNDQLFTKDRCSRFPTASLFPRLHRQPPGQLTTNDQPSSAGGAGGAAAERPGGRSCGPPSDGSRDGGTPGAAHPDTTPEVRRGSAGGAAADRPGGSGCRSPVAASRQAEAESEAESERAAEMEADRQPEQGCVKEEVVLDAPFSGQCGVTEEAVLEADQRLVRGLVTEEGVVLDAPSGPGQPLARSRERRRLGAEDGPPTVPAGRPGAEDGPLTVPAGRPDAEGGLPTGPGLEGPGRSRRFRASSPALRGRGGGRLGWTDPGASSRFISQLNHQLSLEHLKHTVHLPTAGSPGEQKHCGPASLWFCSVLCTISDPTGTA